MDDIEIPIGKRTLKYRLFEMLPATISYGAFVLLVVLSLISPIIASIYLILVIVALLVKAVGIAIHTIQGRKWMESAQKVDWRGRLKDLEDLNRHWGVYLMIKQRYLVLWLILKTLSGYLKIQNYSHCHRRSITR